MNKTYFYLQQVISQFSINSFAMAKVGDSVKIGGSPGKCGGYSTSFNNLEDTEKEKLQGSTKGQWSKLKLTDNEKRTMQNVSLVKTIHSLPSQVEKRKMVTPFRLFTC